MNGRSIKRNIIKLVIAVVIILLCGAAGYFLGFFKGIAEEQGALKVVPETILRLILMTAFMIALNAVLQLIINAIKGKRKRTQTLTTVTASLVKYVVVIVAIIWGLTIIGVNVGTIFAGVGILALVVGFGAESLIADVITGMFMLFENQYNVGDFIEVDGFRGKVTSIGIRTTCIEDAGGNIKIVNNSAMTNILNRSNHNSRAVSVIGIPYETDIEALEANFPEMMKDIYERNKDLMLAEPMYLGVEELADSAVVLKFVVEVEDKNIFSAGRALNRELFLGFRKAGVEVPFPQVDVHQRP